MKSPNEQNTAFNFQKAWGRAYADSAFKLAALWVELDKLSKLPQPPSVRAALADTLNDLLDFQIRIQNLNEVVLDSQVSAPRSPLSPLPLEPTGGTSVPPALFQEETV